MRCHDVTHDVMAPSNDVTSENKRCASDVVRLKCVNMELLKMAAKPKTGITQITG